MMRCFLILLDIYCSLGFWRHFSTNFNDFIIKLLLCWVDSPVDCHAQGPGSNLIVDKNLLDIFPLFNYLPVVTPWLSGLDGELTCKDLVREKKFLKTFFRPTKFIQPIIKLLLGWVDSMVAVMQETSFQILPGICIFWRHQLNYSHTYYTARLIG